jgi:hypothetical protein
MAALNFPPSPSTNQIYSANGKSWRFDGTSWKSYYILNVQGGGTGNTYYNLGDILVGAGTSLYPLPIGANNLVLTADNSTQFGITWKATAATGITTLNSLTSTQQYFSVGTSGSGFNISSLGSTHTFNIPIAGAATTGLISTLAQTIAGQKTFTSSIIGDLSGTASTATYAHQSGYAITSGFATTANYAHQSGYGITSGFATTASYSYQSGYGFTSGFATTATYSYQSGYGLTSGLATTATYAHQSGYAITSGFATTSANVNVANAVTNSAHPLHFSPVATGSGVAVSSNTAFSLNPSTLTLSTSGLAVTASTFSTSTSTGALTVVGGVGIGGSLFTGTSTADSISGVVLNNGVITSGSWAGSTITAYYGGTGNTSYILGDLLVGAGSTFIKLPVGINSYVLGADSTKPSGVGWTTVTPLSVSDTPPSSPKNADLWFNSLDGGLLVYYSDVNTNQWVEIALGSGVDLSQLVYITNTTPSTSTSTGALIVDGGVGIAGTVFASSFSINGVYDQISSTLVTSATTVNQVALSINASSFRTAKMFVQVTSGSNYHSQEILMVHDGSQVYMTEYAMVNTGAIGSTFDGDISGANMRFLVTPTNAVTTYKIACSVMRI